MLGRLYGSSQELLEEVSNQSFGKKPYWTLREGEELERYLMNEGHFRRPTAGDLGQKIDLKNERSEGKFSQFMRSSRTIDKCT